MKNKFIIEIIFVILLSFTIIAQEEEHNFTKTKELIDSGVSCTKLTNEQLEEIGDYYMEQMHPGEAHEYMDRMMGGEGSETLKQVHITIAKRIYCNENIGMMGGGMMAGRGMMGNYYQTPQNNNPYQSNNDSYQDNFSIFQIFFYTILTLVIIVLILIIMLINKSKNNIKQKRR